MTYFRRVSVLSGLVLAGALITAPLATAGTERPGSCSRWTARSRASWPVTT